MPSKILPIITLLWVLTLTFSRPTDGMSSLGRFDEFKSFGSAFKAAHSTGGSGHTFTYNGKLYNTNTRDGGDYRREPDNRSVLQHKVRQYVHELNKVVKDTTGIHAQDYLSERGFKWNSDVDRQRADYHEIEARKKANK